MTLNIKYLVSQSSVRRAGVAGVLIALFASSLPVVAQDTPSNALSNQQATACKDARVEADWSHAVDEGRKLRDDVKSLRGDGRPYTLELVQAVADYYSHGVGYLDDPSCEARVTKPFCRDLAISLLFEMAKEKTVADNEPRAERVAWDPKLPWFTVEGANALRGAVSGFLQRTLQDEDHLREAQRRWLYSLVGEVYRADESDAAKSALTALETRTSAPCSGAEIEAAQAAMDAINATQ